MENNETITNMIVTDETKIFVPPDPLISGKSKRGRKKIKDVIDLGTINGLVPENTKNVIFESIEGKFVHVLVGSEKSPATDDDINDIETKLTKLINDNGIKALVFVTHHSVIVNIH